MKGSILRLTKTKLQLLSKKYTPKHSKWRVFVPIPVIKVSVSGTYMGGSVYHRQLLFKERVVNYNLLITTVVK